MRLFSTTRGALLAALLAGAPFVLGAQRFASTAFVAPGATAAPTAAELLRQAAKAFAGIKTFNFTLVAKDIAPGIRLSGVSGGDGTAAWPDQLVFRGSIQRTPAMTVPFVTVMCGPDQYIEMGDGTFQKMPGSPNVGKLLFAPDSSLVAGILEKLEKPSAPKAVTLDKVITWQVSGTVPSTLLAVLPTPAKSTAPLHAQLWIDQQDAHVRQVTLTGPMFTGDTEKTVRTLTFSNFNEKIPFTVPRGKAPCGPQP